MYLEQASIACMPSPIDVTWLVGWLVRSHEIKPGVFTMTLPSDE